MSLSNNEQNLPLICPECKTPLSEDLKEILFEGRDVFCEMCGFRFTGIKHGEIKPLEKDDTRNLSLSQKEKRKKQWEEWKRQYQEWKKQIKEQYRKFKENQKEKQKEINKENKERKTSFLAGDSYSKKNMKDTEGQNYKTQENHNIYNKINNQNNNINNKISDKNNINKKHNKLTDLIKIIRFLNVITVPVYIIYFLTIFGQISSSLWNNELPLNLFFQLIILILIVIIDLKEYLPQESNEINPEIDGLDMILVGIFGLSVFGGSILLLLRGIFHLILFYTLGKDRFPYHPAFVKGKSQELFWAETIRKRFLSVSICFLIINFISLLLQISISKIVTSSMGQNHEQYSLTFNFYLIFQLFICLPILGIFLYYYRLNKPIEGDSLEIHENDNDIPPFMLGLILILLGSIIIITSIGLIAFVFGFIIVFENSALNEIKKTENEPPIGLRLESLAPGIREKALTLNLNLKNNKNKRIDDKSKNILFSQKKPYSSQYNQPYQIEYNVHQQTQYTNESFSQYHTLKDNQYYKENTDQNNLQARNRTNKLSNKSYYKQTLIQNFSEKEISEQQKYSIPKYDPETGLLKEEFNPFKEQEKKKDQLDYLNRVFLVIEPEIKILLMKILDEKERIDVAKNLIKLTIPQQKSYLEEYLSQYNESEKKQEYIDRIEKLPLNNTQKKTLIRQLDYLPPEEFEEFIKVLEDSIGKE